MRYFYKKLFCFLLFLLGVNYLTHYAFLELVNKNSIVFKEDKIFFSSIGRNISILFLGDSHVNAVKSHVIPNVYRFNSVGENFIQSYYKLKYLLTEGITIDTLVLPYDLHSFSSFRSDRIINDIYWNKYVDYFELARRKNDKGYILKYVMANFFSYQGKGDEILEYLQKRHSLIKIGSDDVDADRVGYHFKDSKIVDDDILYFFEELLDLCEESNMKVILMKYPVSKQYYEAASKFLNPEHYYGSLDSILLKFGDLNYEIWDYHDLFFDHPEYFMDADHLTNNGCIKFSEAMSKRILAFNEK